MYQVLNYIFDDLFISFSIINKKEFLEILIKKNKY